jgi:predicted ATPase
LLAQALHRASPRASGRFVSVNCAAIPEGLLEAELFGYERGAFTDARQGKPGLFQLAHRGTLFLDEVGLLPTPLQGKLLSAIEDRGVRRLGATRSEPADVWILAATNEDLGEALSSRRFRPDLYHRLSVLTLDLPPLRDRIDDVLGLARHFLSRACAEYGLPELSLSADARAALRAYAWPGNVRELINVIERAALLSDTDVLTAAHLALPAAHGASREAAPHPSSGGLTTPSARDVMRDHLLAALTQTGWNISRTASQLGLSRVTVRARIARFGLRAAGTAREGRLPSPPAEPAPDELESDRRQPTTVNRGRWQSRRVTLLRVHMAAPADAELHSQNLLDLLGDKLRGFGGRIEGLSPSGLVAAFGLDLVDEPAVLAAHAAMVIHNAAKQAQLESDDPVAVKIGLHTAEILASSGPASPILDADASREAGNVLGALIEKAEPGTTVATEPAAALLRRRFRLAAPGPQSSGYRVEGLWHARLGRRSQDGQLAGRREELAILEAHLGATLRGLGRAVSIAGDAGIGKSRLLAELVGGQRSEAVTYIEGRCSPAATGIPFFPLLSIVRGACGISDSDPPEVVAGRVTAALEEASLDTPALLPILVQLLATDPVADPALDPASLRKRSFAAIRQLLLGRSARTPLLIAVEDLHWVDPTSEACLASLIDVLGSAPMLLVMTYRTGYRPPWVGRAGVTCLPLLPLTPADSLAVVRGVLQPGEVSDAVLHRILTRAEGNPLFLEELSRAALERDDGTLPDRVPATIEEVIAIRIRRLKARPRQLLTAAAVIGRDVPLRLLREIAQIPDEEFPDALGQLQRAEFLSQEGGGPEPHYTFKHALGQEVSYDRVPADQRRRLHVLIVGAIERLYASRLNDQVEWLAHHAVRGEVWDKAVRYLMQASLRAAARSAMAEASNHVTVGLTLLEKLPESLERDRQELDLQTALGAALRGTKGYAAPETGAAYARARALCEKIEETPHLLSVIHGQCVFHLLRADYGTALELGEQILAHAQRRQEPSDLVEAHTMLGMVSLFRGEFVRAREQLEMAVGLYDPERGRSRFVFYGTDTKATCLAYQARILSALGYPDRAVERAKEAVALAEARSLPLSVAQAVGVLANIHQLRRDVGLTREWSERATAYATERGFPYWAALGDILRGWVQAERGERATGIARIQQSLDRYRSTGATLGLSWFLALLAETHAKHGQSQEGLRVLNEALEWVEKTGEGYWEAELYRLRGDLLSVEGGSEAAAAAEASVLRSLDIARRQRAKLWELRAAMSLTRLWRGQGRLREARELLTPIYAWFTEGLDTADLQDARDLLEALARET